MDFIKDKLQFFNFLRENKKVKLKFKKKDGSNRIMNATLDFNEIPPQQRPKEVDTKKFLENAEKGYFNVYDIDKKDWRKVNYETTEWIESGPNFRFRIKK